MCHRIWIEFLVATHNVSETNRMHSQHPPRVSKHLSMRTHGGDVCGMLSLSLSLVLLCSRGSVTTKRITGRQENVECGLLFHENRSVVEGLKGESLLRVMSCLLALLKV
jgi:hypothetical protein